MPHSLKTVKYTVDFGEPAGREDFHVYSRYTDLTPLGAGGYGYVVSAIDTQATNAADREVVIKKLPSIFKTHGLTKAGLREVTLLLFFVHDNILALRDIILPLAEQPDGTPYFDNRQLEFHGLYLVLEKMSCDLGHLIYSEMDLPVDIRRLLVYQILRGVKCIHSARVLHRDIKPQNILVNEECDVKICDFGLAREYESNGMTTFVATQFYRAPELLLEMSRGDQEPEGFHANTIYNAAVDVWSIGCIMAELLLRRPLFQCSSSAPAWQISTIFGILGRPEITEDMAVEIKSFLEVFGGGNHSGKPWEDILPQEMADPDEIDLISKMVIFDPAKRISVAEAMVHPFLADLHDPDDEPDAPTMYCFKLQHPDDPYLDMLSYFAQMHPEARSLRGWPAGELQRSYSTHSIASTLGSGSPRPSFLLQSLRSMHGGKWDSLRHTFAQNNCTSFQRMASMGPPSSFRAPRSSHSVTNDSADVLAPNAPQAPVWPKTISTCSDASDLSSLIQMENDWSLHSPSPDRAGLTGSITPQDTDWWSGLRPASSPQTKCPSRTISTGQRSSTPSSTHSPHIPGPGLILEHEGWIDGPAATPAMPNPQLMVVHIPAGLSTHGGDLHSIGVPELLGHFDPHCTSPTSPLDSSVTEVDVDNQNDLLGIPITTLLITPATPSKAAIPQRFLDEAQPVW